MHDRTSVHRLMAIDLLSHCAHRHTDAALQAETLTQVLLPLSHLSLSHVYDVIAKHSEITSEKTLL